ncbi:MAG TPA: DEAD/DEAH box helicase [Methanosarcina sp.]|nr:DEAD/DEAH box helicase [Methanosarcina sp.]
MRLAFSSDKSVIFFIHSDGAEYKFLHNFPAFVKEGPYFCIPAKVHVLHNIVSRLQKAKRKLDLDKDVYDFLQQPFKLKDIPSSFRFHTEPMDYQRIALRYLWTVGSGGILLEPGMGKSKVVLDYIHLANFKKVVIVCPKALLFVWEDEIAIHRPELTYYTVKSTDWESEREGIKNAQVTIINYTKAVTFEKELASVGYEFIHLDEFLIKDPTTERTKSLTSLSKKIPYKCGGSGTLVNNSVLDVFAPSRYLEPGLVGFNYTNFKERHTVPNPKDKRQIVGYRRVDEARSVLDSCCIVMTKEKWLKNLPEKKFFDISVSLDEEQKNVYWGLTKNYIAEVNGRYVEVDNPLVMMSKLYQISNGFLYINEEESDIQNDCFELTGEDGPKKKKKKRTTHFFPSQPKIRALEELITGKLKNRRSLIWFNMEAEYQLIKELLDKLGHSYLTIKGGDKEIGAKVRQFNRDASVQWLICQAKSVNYGVTVMGTSREKLESEGVEVLPGLSTEVHTEIFYSLNFSLEVYLQQQDRVHRLGQKHTCEYYRIFATTPVESRIKSAIEEKMTIRYDMLVDIAESLRNDTGDLVKK